MSFGQYKNGRHSMLRIQHPQDLKYLPAFLHHSTSSRPLLSENNMMIASVTILSLLSTVVHASILSLTASDSTGSGNFSVLATVSDLPDAVPATCNRQCNGPVATKCSENTEDASCACSNAFVNELSSCIDCIVANDRSLTVQDGQSAMDSFTQNCNSLGFNVKSSKISPNGAMRVGVGAVLGAGAAAGVSLLLL